MKAHLTASLLVSAAVLSTPIAALASGTPVSGTMYYTTFSGGRNIHTVNYNFNGTTFTFSGNTDLGPGTPGADGIVFTSDGQLAIGGQGGNVYKVNATTGALMGSPTSGGTSAFHMMAAPDGKIWSSGIPGAPAYYNSTLTVNGTPFPVHGGDSSLDTMAWTTADPNQAFYTTSGPGGFGDFGKVDLTTGVTTRLLSGVPAAHGMAYDPYSGKLILMGDGHISEIDPSTGTIISDLVLGGTYDQGTVDGKGHIFAANNDGDLTFIDYSSTKLLATADFI